MMPVQLNSQNLDDLDKQTVPTAKVLPVAEAVNPNVEQPTQ